MSDISRHGGRLKTYLKSITSSFPLFPRLTEIDGYTEFIVNLTKYRWSYLPSKMFGSFLSG